MAIPDGSLGEEGLTCNLAKSIADVAARNGVDPDAAERIGAQVAESFVKGYCDTDPRRLASDPVAHDVTMLLFWIRDKRVYA